MQARFLMLAAVCAVTLASCGADDPVARGLAIVSDNCARCHAIGATGDSPRAEALPFRQISQRYPVAYLEEALAEGIVTGHNDMPPFVLEPAQISDVIAYLESIQI